MQMCKNNYKSILLPKNKYNRICGICKIYFSIFMFLFYTKLFFNKYICKYNNNVIGNILNVASLIKYYEIK